MAERKSFETVVDKQGSVVGKMNRLANGRIEVINDIRAVFNDEAILNKSGFFIEKGYNKGYCLTDSGDLNPMATKHIVGQ